jgi:hypothetical protein
VSIKARIRTLARRVGIGRLWGGLNARDPAEFVGLGPFSGPIDPDRHPGAARCQAMMGAVCVLHDAMEPARLRRDWSTALAAGVGLDTPTHRELWEGRIAEVEGRAAEAREIAGTYDPDATPEQVRDGLLQHLRCEHRLTVPELAEARKHLDGMIEHMNAPGLWG